MNGPIIDVTRFQRQMMSSIPTLLNICLEFVSDNLCSLLSVIYVPETEKFYHTDGKLYTEGNSLPEKYVLRDDMFFPENIAEKLMTLLSRKGKLNDDTMKLFERDTTRLRRVDIPDASRISKNGLLTIKDHKLVEIAVFSHKLPMDDVIECLGEYNLDNLQTVVFSKYPPKENMD